MAKSFHELSPRTQMVIFVLCCGLTVVGAWQVLHRAGSRSELAAVRAQARVGSGRSRARAGDRREAAAARSAKSQASEAALQQTTAVLPDEKDPQDVLRNLHDLASESSLDIATFTPKPIVVKPQYRGMADHARPRGHVSRPRPLLRPHRDDVAADVGVRACTSRSSRRSRATARASITASCMATTFVFKKELMMAPPSGGKK